MKTTNKKIKTLSSEKKQERKETSRPFLQPPNIYSENKNLIHGDDAFEHRWEQEELPAAIPVAVLSLESEINVAASNIPPFQHNIAIRNILVQKNTPKEVSVLILLR